LESDDIKDWRLRTSPSSGHRAGASHRLPGEGAMIRKRIGPQLSNDCAIQQCYLLKLSADYEDFTSDPRCRP